MQLICLSNCAGAQWEKASEVFEEMQSQGCTPDVVTYTALISSYEKGGQWRRALAAFNQMRQRRCAPDSIVYNAIIDALWETGVIWAQRQVGKAFAPPSLGDINPEVANPSTACNFMTHRTGVSILVEGGA